MPSAWEFPQEVQVHFPELLATEAEIRQVYASIEA